MLVAGQPVGIFFATQREWIPHSKGLSGRWPQPASARGGTEAGDGRLRQAVFVQTLPALNGLSDMEILVADPETGQARRVARVSGSRLPRWLLMQRALSPSSGDSKTPKCAVSEPRDDPSRHRLCSNRSGTRPPAAKSSDLSK
jgi:hypothetical protein